MAKNNVVEFSSFSMMDDFGRVFFSNNKVFRAIQNNKIDYCLELLNSDLFKELTTKGLVPVTIISDFEMEEYKLVLEHEKLLVIGQHEWSFDMLRDAALTVLEINEICNKHGFELKDAHTLNIIFRGTKPVLADIGSISKIECEGTHLWVAYEEFLGSFVIPLMFWGMRMNYITRKLLESNFHRMFTIPAQSLAESGLLKLLFKKNEYFQFKLRNYTLITQTKESKILKIITDFTRSTVKSVTGRNTQIFSYNKIGKQFNNLSDYFPKVEIQNRLESLRAPNQESIWKGYHKKNYRKESNLQYSKRFLRIMEIIKGYTPEIDSIIDLAGNEGYFCKLISDETSIGKIILVDYDENAINEAYSIFKTEGCKIHTALLNFMFTPDINGTAKRLRCDLAIALAITHHLILTGKFSINCILERIKSYSKKYVMIEFMPLGLWATGDKDFPVVPHWYNVDWFRTEFSKYFYIINEEQLEENRILFFGTIKNSLDSNVE